MSYAVHLADLRPGHIVHMSLGRLLLDPPGRLVFHWHGRAEWPRYSADEDSKWVQFPLVVCRICLSTTDLIGEYGRYAVCRSCLRAALEEADAERVRAATRARLGLHDCPAEGCQVCMEVGA